MKPDHLRVKVTIPPKFAEVVLHLPSNWSTMLEIQRDAWIAGCREYVYGDALAAATVAATIEAYDDSEVER